MFDILFFIDIILTFKTAILTEDYNIIDDKKIIARIYLNGWFLIDFLSCIPFGSLAALFLSSKASNKVNMVKLIKLLRIAKIAKDKMKIFKYMDLYLGIEHQAF